MIPQYEEQILLGMWKELLHCEWLIYPTRPNAGWGKKKRK